MITTFFIKLFQFLWYLIKVPYYLFILLFIPKSKRNGSEIEGLLSVKDIFVN